MTAATLPEPAKKPKSVAFIALVVLGVAVVSCSCVGIVSAVAIPAFINYVKRAKVAEAVSNVDVLAGAVRRHCEQTGGYPPAAGPIPESPTSGAQSPDFRADQTFPSIGFNPGVPVYYSYAIETTADGVDVVAYGDLDGDGVRSERRVRCGAGCACAAPFVANELE